MHSTEDVDLVSQQWNLNEIHSYFSGKLQEYPS